MASPFPPPPQPPPAAPTAAAAAGHALAAASASSNSSSADAPPDPPEPANPQDPRAARPSPSSHPPSPSPTSAASRLWSSFISPSEQSSKAASSFLESRRSAAAHHHHHHRTPSYEEFRAQEPPQARLLRLRGLFDVLLDKDDESALAGGRAKEEWTRSAMRARYGAGGALARGSLAPQDAVHQSISAFISQSPADSTNGSASSTNAAATTNTSSSSSSSSSSASSPGAPRPPRQSYARELLNQCRQCRAELERERELDEKRRQRRRGGGGGVEEEGGSSSGGWLDWVPFASSAESQPASDDAVGGGGTSALGRLFGSKDGQQGPHAARAPATTTSSSPPPSGGALRSTLSLLLGEASSAQPPAPPPPPSHLADHEGEAGWVGSGVWGLSAVGHRRRGEDRERDRRVEKGEEVEDDGGRRQRQIEWEGFLRYADGKERELYQVFTELDKNGDMTLDVSEIRTALDRAGLEVPPANLRDFIASLACSSSEGCESGRITFPQFRDYLLLLPRRPSVNEIYRFYQVRKAFGLFGSQGIFAEFSEHWGRSQRHGATAVTSDGDVSLAGEEKAKKVGGSADPLGDAADGRARAGSAPVRSQDPRAGGASSSRGAGEGDANAALASTVASSGVAGSSAGDAAAEADEDDDSDVIDGTVAVKFLLAGGIAGAVSRTATAPFDRLKIYLITSGQQPVGGGAGVGAAAQSAAGTAARGATVSAAAKSTAAAAAKAAASAPVPNPSLLSTAIVTLYREGGGLKAFWLGNGLNCLKIFPESAIKFLSYETSKRAFAKYVDHVSDSRDISGSSRFVSGGIGGIASQLAIYPIETLKTRLMSSSGVQASKGGPEGRALLVATARDMWRHGGLRTYYRGLTAGLIGVFPYSAIDMSTFEGIKLFWIRYSGREEPSVLALLAFGSISGSVGATTVYPLNLVRTRLQAAGTPAHPRTYDGFWDAVRKTYALDGMVGFYRGLVPTLAKVVPAVSLSYVAYEHSKRHLGVQ